MGAKAVNATANKLEVFTLHFPRHHLKITTCVGGTSSPLNFDKLPYAATLTVRQEEISSAKRSHALLQNDSCPLAPTDRSKSVTRNHLHDQRTHLAARWTTNQQIQFPIWSLCLYIPLLLSIPLHQTTLSHTLMPFITRSLCISSPAVSHSLSFALSSLSLSPAIPAVVKAMVFCGGSWLGLICQAADLPSLLFSSSSLSLALLPFYPVIRWSKEERIG